MPTARSVPSDLSPRRCRHAAAALALLVASLALAACDTGTPVSSGSVPPANALVDSPAHRGDGSPPLSAAVPVRGAETEPGGIESAPSLDTALDDSSAGATPGFEGALQGDGTVRLSWARDPGAAGYNVYRQGRYLTTVHVERYTDADVSASDGAVSYEIHAFTAGASKTFRKIAENLTVDVSASAPVTVTGTSGFTGTLHGDGTVRLAWRADPRAAGYNVYRQGRYLTTVHVESYADRSLPAGTYRYEIHSFTAGEAKTFRKIADKLTVEVPPTRPGGSGNAPPSVGGDLADDLVVSDAPQRDFVSSRTDGFKARLLDDGSVRLSWRRDPDAAGYNVYRQGRYLTTVHGEHFTDRGLSRGDYRYEIHAFTGGSRKTFRRIATGLAVEVRPVAAAAVPDRPGGDGSGGSGTPSRLFSSTSTPGFRAEILDNGAVRLSWGRDGNAEGYNVYRQGRYHTTVHTESYTDTKVFKGDYRYEIHSFTRGTPKRFRKIAHGLSVSVPESTSGGAPGEAGGGESGGDAAKVPDAEIPAAKRGGASPRTFTSETTPGFTGQLLDGGKVRIGWPADPDAAGYNVYRNARYYKTVHAAEFTDTGIFDRDYYYEIQSFTRGANKRYRRVATGLTVKVRGLGRLDPDAPRPDPTRLDGYDLVFADEFDTGTLDTSKWNTSYLWGADLTINSEKQYYVDIRKDPDFGFDPFTFEDGKLVINSIRTPPALREKANGKPYLSGVITSYDAFKFTYGYAEMRARMPYGKGYWTAFWLLNAYYGDEDPEIDIVEFIGHDQDVAYHTYHYYDAGGKLRSTKSEPTPGIDFTADFHTFGVDWRPGSLVFYIDGIEVHRISDPEVSDQDMYLIANTALGGWWPGSPDDTTPFPGRYEIDYIRVYRQRAPYAAAPFSDAPSALPPAPELPRRESPGHRPPFELWPEGYPARAVSEE